MRKQCLAGFGKRNSAPVTSEQDKLELHFEPPDLFAQSGLIDRELHRRAREAAGVGDADKYSSCLRSIARRYSSLE